MKTYTYRDTKKNEILFTSVEEDHILLTQVDVKFEIATGIDPSKVMWIGCSIDPMDL